LSFAIFDELVSTDRLEKLSFKDVIRYRREAEGGREAFLEHLVALQAKQAEIGPDGDYARAIEGIIVNDILPAAREFKNRLDGIYDNLFGALETSALGYLGSSAAVSIFGDLSWPRLLGLAGLVGASIGRAAIDARKAVCSAKRECAISYVLALDV
jgi:hypothetical protein